MTVMNLSMSSRSVANRSVNAGGGAGVFIDSSNFQRNSNALGFDVSIWRVVDSAAKVQFPLSLALTGVATACHHRGDTHIKYVARCYNLEHDQNQSTDSSTRRRVRLCRCGDAHHLAYGAAADCTLGTNRARDRNVAASESPSDHRGPHRHWFL